MAQQLAVLPQSAQPVQSTQSSGAQQTTDKSFASKLQSAEQQKQEGQTSDTQESAKSDSLQEAAKNGKTKDQNDISVADTSAQTAAMALSFESIMKQVFLQTEATPSPLKTEGSSVSAVESMQTAGSQQTGQLQQAVPQQTEQLQQTVQSQPATAVVASEQAVQAAPQVFSEVLPEQPVKDAKQQQTTQSAETVSAQQEPPEAALPITAVQEPAQPKTTGDNKAEMQALQPQQVTDQNVLTQAEPTQVEIQPVQPAAKTVTEKSGKVQDDAAVQTDTTKEPALTGKEGLSSLQYTASLPYDSSNVVIPISHEAVLPDVAPTQQLADQITANLQNDRKEFTMDLFPNDLGKVSVKLVSENGSLTVEISATNPKTQSLLMSNSSEIKSILQTEQPVQVVDASQHKQWYDQQQAPNQQQQQQQQEQEQKKDQSFNGTFSTDDFLTVMQQLRAAAV